MLTCGIFATLGALVRFIDGAAQPIPPLTFGIPNGARVAAFGALAAGAWWIATGEPYLTVWGALWCLLAIIMGNTDWQDWLWSPMRFGLFGLAASWPVGLDMWQVAAVMAVGGLCQPLLFFIDQHVTLSRWWIFDGPEAYSRLPVGAACMSAPLWVV